MRTARTYQLGAAYRSGVRSQRWEAQMSPTKVRRPRSIGLAAGTIAVTVLLRRWSLRCGATRDEVSAMLPGDDEVPRPDLVATRAVTIHAGADRVWPWIAQLGQGRGGFYSYDWLENLVGGDIHNADAIVPAWQHIAIGDQVNLAADVPLAITHLDPGRAMVLGGGIPIGAMSPPFTFSWAFVLRDGSDGGTRLLVRERYGYNRRWAALMVEPTELISFLMTQRMLRGIKHRAERAGDSLLRGTPASL